MKRNAMIGEMRKMNGNWVNTIAEYDPTMDDNLPKMKLIPNPTSWGASISLGVCVVTGSIQYMAKKMTTPKKNRQYNFANVFRVRRKMSGRASNPIGIAFTRIVPSNDTGDT